MAIDVKWFQDRIRDLGTSQRQISAALTKNPNTMSLILNGKRKVTHAELPILADMLDASPDDVLQKLGVELALGQRADTVTASNVVDETGRVSTSTPRAVQAPHNAGDETRAIVFETSTGDGWQHGWIYYFERPAKPKAVDADSLNALCVVEIGDKDGQVLGVVRRGLERGRYDLVNPFSGDKIVSGVQIRNAIPIRWIKTA